MKYPTQELNYYSGISGDFNGSCMIECPGCLRNSDIFKKTSYHNISIENFRKICQTFKDIILNGLISDVIYHPKFHEMLEVLFENNNKVELHTNGHGRSLEWWKKTYEIIKKFDKNMFELTFAIDGMPEDSHNYRVGQDGKNVFEIMKLGLEYDVDVVWQYIVFKYNENDIERAKQLAFDNNLKFLLVKSSRWETDYADEYIPSEENRLNSLDTTLKDEYVFKPRCINRTMIPTYSAEGYIVPCCFAVVTDDEYILNNIKQDHLKVENVEDLRMEIFNSDEWNDMFELIMNDPDNVPELCKRTCYERVEPRKIKQMFYNGEMIMDRSND